ncbi:alkaline phosphatase D family protein [Prosthecomicrobium hirschii]|uniref:alkaline phosphatase D family protein n=1 Tax=Prosthecodimorpha hirschii TaxID=665126 RepID=UPI00221FC43F|nr:alkaline phosphatase D family protein [Prosthecomicrobium hirschii]MCW1838689.1 alkaline phosphatase D family protein [Prosthecomicrobium hirschii]
MRHFLAAAIALSITAPAAAGELPNGVASGDVTATSAVIWARAAVSGRMKFEIATGKNFKSYIGTAINVSDTAVPHKFHATGLLPDRIYEYRATDAAGNRSAGRFRTLPQTCATSDVRFGVSGDWRGEIAPYPSIRNVPDRGLQFFVELGDTIYAERYSGPETGIVASTLADYRARHTEVLTARYGMNTWKDLRATTPVFAMIDDHEVVNDFAGGAAPGTDPTRFDQTGNFINETNRYKAGMRAFSDFMPIVDQTWSSADPRFNGKPKLYRSRILGKTAMFAMVDARSFRDTELPGVTDLTNTTEITNFLVASATQARTLLGGDQLAQLKADLLDAKARGIQWKFVMLPEPVQNLGVLAASDRYEGYARERNDLLKFIADNAIDNVVFVTADLHGTMVNNLTYDVGNTRLASKAWEIVTGAVAFEDPFGPTIVDLAKQVGLIDNSQYTYYLSLPTAPDADATVNDKDDFVASVINSSMSGLSYDALGLAGSNVPAKLTKGGYEAMHSYGWTEFAINAKSGKLTVTTWGIAPYGYDDLQSNARNQILARKPAIVSQFEVNAAAVPAGNCRGAN